MSSEKTHNYYAQLLRDAGQAVLEGQMEKGEILIRSNWPHVPRKRTKRTASETRKLAIWIKDGFRCRYCGDLLFFPAYMTALSTLYPKAFPAHRNGKAEFAHDAYWTHFASLEHIDPTSTGGQDVEDNWITTSMARNQVRSRYPIDLLGWSIRAREPLSDWDGGVDVFMRLLEAHPKLRSHDNWGQYLSRWERVVRRVSDS